jgi:ubiquitin-protein ligase
MAAGAFARDRLRRDWAEVAREPSSLVAAEPLPNNIFEWHANLRPNTGVLAGVTFHIRITFPEDYPNSPPFVHFPRREIPSFQHPNLYSFGLCLDILSSFVGQSDERSGWSPAYTVRTLLMQLQSFLFEFDAAPQDHGGNYSCRYSLERIRSVQREAQALVCEECGHCSRSPQPALQRASTFMPVQRNLMSYDGLECTCTSIARAKQEMSKLVTASPAVSCEQAENGLEVLHAQGKVAHLSAASTHLTIRVRALHSEGGIRIGMAAAGCIGLTEGRKTDGCVAWDSAGPLVLGKTVIAGRKQASAGSISADYAPMPQISEGDVIAVRFDQDAGLSFTKNGKTASHDPREVWPQRPLEHFLFNQLEPRIRASTGHVKDLRAMVSFRNASVEVVGDTQLRDEVADQINQRQLDLVHKIAELEKRSENISAHLHEANARVLKLRSNDGAENSFRLGGLPSEILLLAFMGVSTDDVPNLMRVCSSWRQVVLGRGLLERLQLNCFYTKASASEDVLGFGVCAEYHADGNLKALSSGLDVLSLTAFSKFGIRRGVWGDTFEYFLPLVLDGSHVQRALPIMEQSLARLATGCSVHAAAAFEPWMALAVLPQLMNSFAVSLMNAKAGVTRHASEKALLGYCSFHHMLLALAVRHPCIALVAQTKVGNFIRSPSTRHKSEAPDLGQLLVYVALTEDVCWSDIADPVLEECGARSILWLFREKPGLEAAGTSDTVLLRDSFEGRLTGLRLVMFQAFFLRNVACPNGDGPQAALTRYGRQYGLPTTSQKECLFKAARKILDVKTWPAFYACLGLPCPSPHAQAQRLRKAIADSEVFGYHTPSARAWRSAQQKGAQPQSRPQQRKPIGRVERVGVKKNLQDAFKNSKNQSQQNKQFAEMSESAATTIQNKTRALPTVTQVRRLNLTNQFAAFETDTDSDTDKD